MRWILVSLLCFISAVNAQQVAVSRDPGNTYRRGLELFEEKKYNAAIPQFEYVLKHTEDAGLTSEANYYLAMSKLGAGHSDGEAAVQQFLDRNPGSHKTHMANFALGDYWYVRKKYSKALSYYKEVNEDAISKADRDRLRFRKGYCQVGQKKYKDAMETLEPLANKEGEYKIFATYYYAYSAYYVGRYKEALEAFRSVEAEGPKSVKLYIAQIYYLQSYHQKALDQLDKLNLPGQESRIDFLRAKCYYRLDKFDVAVQYFEKSGYGADSMDKNEVYEVAYSHYRTNGFAKASEWFKLIASGGDSLGQVASYNLADCYLNTKAKREAARAFAEAYRTPYNSNIAENALFNHAKLSVELGENNAPSLLQKYIDTYPKSPDAKEARKLLARLLLNTDNFKDAVAVLENINDMDPQTEETYQRVTLARGMELFKARQWNESYEMFTRTTKKTANKTLATQAWFWMAEINIQQERYDAASADYQKYLDGPGASAYEYYPLAFYGMGYVKYKQEKYPEAVTYFEKYVSNASRGQWDDKIYNDAHLRLGDCYLKNSKLEKAINAYAYVTGKKGADADYALFQSAMAYGFNSKKESKIATLKRLTNDYPNSRYIPDAIFEIASEYNELGNFKEAERNYLYLISDFKGSPLIKRCYMTLGRLYYNRNEDNKAIQMYTKLYDEYPNSPEAKTAADNVRRIYEDNGRGSEYLVWAKDRVGVSQNSKDSILFNDAVVFYNKKDWKKASEAFGNYLIEMPKGYFVLGSHFYKAVCHEQLKENQDAFKHYKMVADANGNENQEAAVLSLLRIYGPNGPCDELVIYLEKIERLTKNRETMHNAVAGQMRCYDKLKNYDKSKEKAKQMLEYTDAKDDLLAEAYVMIGKAEYEQKNYKQALRSFAQAYVNYNNIFSAEAKYREALTYYAIDSLEDAKNSCYQFLDQFNLYDYWLGKDMLLLGDVFIAQGNELDAKATWNSIVENFEIPEIVKEAKQRLEDLKNKKPRVKNLIDE